MAITVKRHKQPIDSFDALVRNGIDFFTVSINEFSEKPKYSVIHFCAAIELFLKARLMIEHWALIVDDPRKADTRRFLNGEFKSVTMDQSIERIKAICGETLPKADLRIFNSIRDHRNQFVHFFHPDENSARKETIARELCASWYALHQLLTTRWQFHFEKYQSEIEGVDRQMHSIREFLTVKFENLKDRLSLDRMNGISIDICAVCGLEALEILTLSDPLFEYRCIVCDSNDRFLSLECPELDCPGQIIVEELIGAVCNKCRRISTNEELVSQLTPSPEKAIHCVNCPDAGKTVVSHIGDYLCVCCVQIHEKAARCQRCQSQWVGWDSTRSGFFVCPRCNPDHSD